MTIFRDGWHDVYPVEPPGAYAHVTDGSPCWCKPVVMGNVVLHRPWSECAREVADDLLKSDIFPMPWSTNRT
jgi:hypothetical protein